MHAMHICSRLMCTSIRGQSFTTAACGRPVGGQRGPQAHTCSGVLPSMRRARALLVRSTSGFMSSASAALVSSHSRRVSSRMNFSSKSLRSCAVKDGHALSPFLTNSHFHACQAPAVLAAQLGGWRIPAFHSLASVLAAAWCRSLCTDRSSPQSCTSGGRSVSASMLHDWAAAPCHSDL